jgi:hypothetical protein
VKTLTRGQLPVNNINIKRYPAVSFQPSKAKVLPGHTKRLRAFLWNKHRKIAKWSDLLSSGLSVGSGVTPDHAMDWLVGFTTGRE